MSSIKNSSKFLDRPVWKNNQKMTTRIRLNQNYEFKAFYENIFADGKLCLYLVSLNTNYDNSDEEVTLQILMKYF